MNTAWRYSNDLEWVDAGVMRCPMNSVSQADVGGLSVSGGIGAICVFQSSVCCLCGKTDQACLHMVWKITLE